MRAAAPAGASSAATTGGPTSSTGPSGRPGTPASTPDDLGDLDLLELRSAEWRGLLFVGIDPELPAIEEWLGAICAEDRDICEAVQRNLAAGIYVDGVLAPRHKAGVADFQRRVRAARGADR